MSTRSPRRGTTALALSAVLALAATLAGCTFGDEPVDEYAWVLGGVDCAPYEAYGKHDGESVSVRAVVIDIEARQLEQSWADFETCTGMTVEYAGSRDFESEIVDAARDGSLPDLAMFSQPGLLAAVAETGVVLPAPPAVEANVDAFWSDEWRTYGSVDGVLLAAPLTASVKGLVWYSPREFEAKGVTVPRTLGELDALTAELAGTGESPRYRPWCVGFSSGDASGWPGTDWIENYLLRLSGAAVYDSWSAGDTSFESAPVREAFDAVGSILLNPDYVNGGEGAPASIAATTAIDAGKAIASGTCSLHLQASFYESQWPRGVEVAGDGDIWAFELPALTETEPSTVIAAGDFVAAFSDNSAVAALQTFLSSDTWATKRVALGGALSANVAVDPESAGTALGAMAMAMLHDPNSTVVFDASDLMPASIGSGAFWSGMNDWVRGEPTADVLATIEAARR